jgi:hypothetical protein
MSSDGLALAAAGAAAAGLMWCVNSKRTSAPMSEPSVCASARRASASAPAASAPAASARLAGDAAPPVATDDVFSSNVWSMSEDGEKANLGSVPKKDAHQLESLRAAARPTLRSIELSNGNKGLGGSNATADMRNFYMASKKPKGHRTVSIFNQRDVDSEDEM